MEFSFFVGEPATEPAAEPETRMPLDESTSLIPVARSLKWRQKCSKYFHWAGFFVYFLLLLAEVVVSIHYDVSILCRYFVPSLKASVNSSLHIPCPGEAVEEANHLAEGIVRFVIDILICWIFLTVVARSPRIVGCITILKTFDSYAEVLDTGIFSWSAHRRRPGNIFFVICSRAFQCFTKPTGYDQSD